MLVKQDIYKYVSVLFYSLLKILAYISYKGLFVVEEGDRLFSLKIVAE